MNKFFLIILFSTLLSNCSYEPILTKKNYNFGFEQINSEGETKVNNIIKRKLDRNNDNDNKFDLFFETKKVREIIAVDKKGDPTIFIKKINLKYKIIQDDKEVLNKEIEKNVTYNNLDDKFELSNKEDDIIVYLSESLSDEILRSTLALTK